MAASTRRSTCTGAAEPSATTCPSCSTRSSLAWLAERQVADLVEQQRPLVGAADQAGPVLARVGEGAPAVAEQLALDQRLGQRGAVDGHELAGPARQLVDLAAPPPPCRCRSRPASRMATREGARSAAVWKVWASDGHEGGQAGAEHAERLGRDGGGHPRGAGRRCGPPRTSRRRAARARLIGWPPSAGAVARAADPRSCALPSAARARRACSPDMVPSGTSMRARPGPTALAPSGPPRPSTTSDTPDRSKAIPPSSGRSPHSTR